MQEKFITMCSIICMLVPSVVNASAITVPPDVKDVADSVAELSKAAEYKKRFEQEEDEAALSKQQMEMEMAASWSTVVSLLEQAEKNRALLNANQELLQHMQRDNNSYEQKVREMEEKSRNAWAAAAAQVNYAEALDDAQVEGSLGGEQVSAAYLYASRLQYQAENIDVELEKVLLEYEVLQNKTDLLMGVRDEAAAELDEQENELAEAVYNAGGAMDYVLASRDYYERLLKEKENPYQDVSGFLSNNFM